MSSDFTPTDEREEDRRSDPFSPPADISAEMDEDDQDELALPTGAIVEEIETTSSSSPSSSSSISFPSSSREISSAPVESTDPAVDPAPAAAADLADERTPIQEQPQLPTVGSN
ncbi:hypothetical protein BGZ91_006532 [Linnemannia elongata]|uniref:Uncharacterized protein n=1 Tax=Linnemannia elongata AG-77 TaxID=1314771 RepID=A0A197JZS1_9FUNG|nr:hypothetical protein BGZ91_006532 [Linnemannia elongata]OAQ29734.1 hypothetical protein K457DRAFT_32066 [Linnemannia elongata AG-77]